MTEEDTVCPWPGCSSTWCRCTTRLPGIRGVTVDRARQSRRRARIVDDVADLDDLELNEEDATAMWDGLSGCVDLTAIFVEGMTSDGEVSDESAECMAEGMLESDEFRDFIVADLMGEEPDDSTFMTSGIMTLLADCLTDEELQNIGM
ncbi:MAG: hypothetical protein U5R31_15070 [Acidimicrobiia bacterium]|nr:hypothetical protein [Acidimicrobiia bacterium]